MNVAPRGPTHWWARLQRAGSPTHLAVVRAVFGVHLFVVLASPAVSLLVEWGLPTMPAARSLLPGVLDAHRGGPLLLLLRSIGMVAALLMAVGLFTRVSTWVLFVCFLVTQHAWFRGSLFHDDWLYFTFHLLVLGFAPAGDALAVDRLWRRPPVRDSQAYRWPIEAMILWFASTYVAAGLSKLFPLRKGLMWLDGATAQRLAIEFVRESPLYWVFGHAPVDLSMRWPFLVGSWLTVAVEVGAVLLLVSTRFYVPVLVAIVGLHVAIFLTGIPGFVQIALVQLVLFFPPQHMAGLDRRLAATVRSQEPAARPPPLGGVSR